MEQTYRNESSTWPTGKGGRSIIRLAHLIQYTTDRQWNGYQVYIHQNGGIDKLSIDITLSNYGSRSKSALRSVNLGRGQWGKFDFRAKKRSAYSNQLNVCTTLSAFAVVKFNTGQQSTLVIDWGGGEGSTKGNISIDYSYYSIAYGYLDYGIVVVQWEEQWGCMCVVLCKSLQ